jgi:hypothetical protein
MLADGGDCLADLRTVRDQQSLFGAVASDTTAFRVIQQVAADPALLEGLRVAHAEGRVRAWELGVKPSELVIDVDATLIVAHSEKDGAAGTFKGGFGFHPLLAFLDGSREALAGLLRPGSAAPNTATDHITVLDEGLSQLPEMVVADPEVPIVVRTDSAGAIHKLADYCREGRLNLLAGFDLTEPVRQAILALGEDAWHPAIRQDGELREGAQVAEITQLLNLTDWPEGYRVIVRRERPHPGAQLSFTDHDGHRFLATLTDLDGNAVEIERLHRARANAEDRIRAAKQTGLANLPFRDFHLNQIWLDISLIAQDLIIWTQALALAGQLAICEPKTLRYRLLHTAARLAFHARRARLRLQHTWPWATELAAAFTRLAALPPPPAR